VTGGADGSGALLVAFASQTGRAEDLAWMTASCLSEAGVPTRVALLGDFEPEDLKTAGRALIIASTTGKGDAPDAMSWFARRHMAGPADLHGLSYGLLALGDRRREDFCGFGRALDGWLRRSGATPLFDRIEVDDGDPAAIRLWLGRIGVIAGRPVEPG
jgi:sulfite reductase (NADPH) flavoprotein alpha-component